MASRSGKRRARALCSLTVAAILAGAVPAAAAAGWAVVKSPNPVGAQQTFLEGVSCTPTPVTAIPCFAVGSYIASNGKVQTLIERWAGKSWAVVKSPNHTGAIVSALSAVSCGRPTSCFAVGSYRATPTSAALTLIVRWNGTSWSPVASANSPRATGSYLNSVSCVNATNCMAVGYYVSSATAGSTFIEHWNGVKWTIMASPNGPRAATSMFSGVSCTYKKALSCFAVGNYATSSTGDSFYTLTARFGTNGWAYVASPNFNKVQNSALNAVACVSPSYCLAVGYWQHKPGAPLGERWNGKSWAIVTVPAPAGFTFAQVNGISCTATNNCFAVGAFSTDLLGHNQTLIERWNGTAWGFGPSPLPAGPSSTLTGVTCTGTACWGVGSYLTSAFGNPSASLVVHKS